MAKNGQRVDKLFLKIAKDPKKNLENLSLKKTGKNGFFLKKIDKTEKKRPRIKMSELTENKGKNSDI